EDGVTGDGGHGAGHGAVIGRQGIRLQRGYAEKTDGHDKHGDQHFDQADAALPAARRQGWRQRALHWQAHVLVVVARMEPVVMRMMRLLSESMDVEQTVAMVPV